MTLSEIVARFPTLRIAVVGDAIHDFYVWGRVTKLSQEAPVPVFVEDKVERRDGGALNVVNNLAQWVARTRFWGSPETSRKYRYMAGHHQVFRQDFDVDWKPSAADVQAMRETLRADVLDAIILSDYAKGTCRASVCEAAIELCRDLGIPCIVDPKGSSWTKYAGATVICPNEAESAALRVSAPDCDILEKRGAQGIQIHYRGCRVGPLIPARGRHVFDVTGAGDTVVAAVGATLAAGGTLEDAAQIGCIAAGYVVGEVGTAVCPLTYLESECASSCAPVVSTASMKATSGY